MVHSLPPGTVANALLAALHEGKPRWLSDLKSETGYTRKQVSNAAALLRKNELLHLEEPGRYKLTKDGLAVSNSGVEFKPGPKAPTNTRRLPANTLRQRAWRAMKVRGMFTVQEIVGDAEQGDAQPEDNLRRWFRWLKACGYVTEMVHRKKGMRQGSNGHKRYRLVKFSGPKAPVYSLARELLLDPNTGEEHPCKIKP